MYRSAVWFFVKLVAFYVALMAPWPGVESGFSKGFARCADYMTYGFWNPEEVVPQPKGMFGTDAIARVYSKRAVHEGDALAADMFKGESKDDARDIGILVGNIKTFANINHPRTTSRHLGYVPLAVFISFTLAYRVGWKRRVVALALGIPLTLFFVGIRFVVLMLALFGRPAIGVFTLTPWWDTVLAQSHNLLCVVLATSYVVPILIWGMVALRRRDVDQLMSEIGSGGRASA
jgi:hypothetical protein